MNGLLQHKASVLKESRDPQQIQYVAGYIQALDDISNTEYGDIE